MPWRYKPRLQQQPQSAALESAQDTRPIPTVDFIYRRWEGAGIYIPWCVYPSSGPDCSKVKKMCINPSFIYLNRGPTVERTPVPCRHCWRCRKNRVLDYVGRSLCEAAYSDWTLSLTLTYAQRSDHAEKILTPRHFQQFIRNVRKRGHYVRYLVAGEYGSLKDRAHFHAILFGKGNKPEITNRENTYYSPWSHGYVFADWSADERAIAYPCKYLLKNDPGDYWFSISKKPPIGAQFFADKADKAAQLGVLPYSFEYQPPGGDSNRTYLMTGATRRDYLSACVDAWSKHRPMDRRRLSEWVAKSLDKLEYQRAVKRNEATPLHQQEESFLEYVHLLAPSERQVVRSVIDANTIWLDSD